MDEATVADLSAAVERIDGDNDVRAATPLGEDSVFCVGLEFEIMHEKIGGLGKAKEIILMDEYIAPDEATQCNLVTEVVPEADVDERAS